MNKQEWDRFAKEFNSHLNSTGVFLTAEADGHANTMAIGWGSAGIYWTKPVVVAPVRFSRFTHDLIEKSGCFTVSIPREGALAKEMNFCGTKSGRDLDKHAACGLTLMPGRTVAAPVITQAWMHIECRMLYKFDMSGDKLDDGIDSRFYSDRNYHTLYFGEAVDFYET